MIGALKRIKALPDTLTEDQKQEIMDKAHSSIILSLGDKALREVPSESSAQAIWLKLEQLYMMKSLANRFYLKHRLYSFKMQEDKPISDQIDEFNKIIDDLENIEVSLEDEDKALILLNSIPRSYEHFKDAVIYGRDQSITLEEMQSAIRAKDLQKNLDLNPVIMEND